MRPLLNGDTLGGDMAQRRGISGDEIRREQEESQRRSRLGERRGARLLEPSISIVVTGIEIDWLVPVVACAVLGFGKTALVLAAVAIGLDFIFSSVVTIRRGDDGVHASIRKRWRHPARARHLVVDSARLRYWNAWLCQGLELVGANASVAACGKRKRGGLRPPLGVPSTPVGPRFRPTARSMALNLPNILLNVGTIVALWGAGRFSLVIAVPALHSAVSSLAKGLLGGPELLVTPPEY